MKNQNNQNSNWKKILGFRNTQEKLEKKYYLFCNNFPHFFQCELLICRRRIEHCVENQVRIRDYRTLLLPFCKKKINLVKSNSTQLCSCIKITKRFEMQKISLNCLFFQEGQMNWSGMIRYFFSYLFVYISSYYIDSHSHTYNICMEWFLW